MTHGQKNIKIYLHFFCFLLGNSPKSEFYMPKFRNTLFHLHRPMKMEQCVPKRRHKNSEAGELHRRKQKTFRTRRKFEVKNIANRRIRNNWNWTILFLTWNMRDNEADETSSHSFSLCQGLQRAANWEPEGVHNDLVWKEKKWNSVLFITPPPAFKNVTSNRNKCSVTDESLFITANKHSDYCF